MGRPSYDDATLAEYFQGASSALFDDPSVGPVLRRLASQAPDVLAAVADVDRSQIRDAQHRAPLERVRLASERWNVLASLRAHG